MIRRSKSQIDGNAARTVAAPFERVYQRVPTVEISNDRYTLIVVSGRQGKRHLADLVVLGSLDLQHDNLRSTDRRSHDDLVISTLDLNEV